MLPRCYTKKGTPSKRLSIFAPLVQWIELFPAKEGMQVRALLGAQKRVTPNQHSGSLVPPPGCLPGKPDNSATALKG